jgi:hypothetical protein
MQQEAIVSSGFGQPSLQKTCTIIGQLLSGLVYSPLHRQRIQRSRKRLPVVYLGSQAWNYAACCTAM